MGGGKKEREWEGEGGKGTERASERERETWGDNRVFAWLQRQRTAIPVLSKAGAAGEREHKPIREGTKGEEFEE